MKGVAMVTAYFLAFAFGVSAGIYLVMNDHPWFAIVVFIMTGSLRLKTS